MGTRCVNPSVQYGSSRGLYDLWVGLHVQYLADGSDLHVYRYWDIHIKIESTDNEMNKLKAEYTLFSF